MPHRIEHLIVSVTSIVGWAVSSIASAMALLLPKAIVAQVETEKLVSNTIIQIGILDDERIRLVAVIGAVSGGILTASVFAPPVQNGKQFSIKVFTSALAGIFLTPLVIHKLNLPITFDYVAPTAFLVAVVGVGVIKAGVPLFQKFVLSKYAPPSNDQKPQ